MYVFGGYTDHNHNDTFQYHFGTAPLCVACRAVRVRVQWCVCVCVHGLTTHGRAGTREWTQLECTGEVPSQRSGHNAVMYNGAMYVFGGYDGSKRLNDLFKLDISTSHSLQGGCGNGVEVAADVSWLCSALTW